jgi:hypothetical protein
VQTKDGSIEVMSAARRDGACTRPVAHTACLRHTPTGSRVSRLELYEFILVKTSAITRSVDFGQCQALRTLSQDLIVLMADTNTEDGPIKLVGSSPSAKFFNDHL